MPIRFEDLPQAPEKTGGGSTFDSLPQSEPPQGYDFQNPINEQHPDLANFLNGGSRFLLKTWSDAGPETMRRNLEKHGFEARNTEGMKFSIRRPGEREWRVLDPGGWRNLDPREFGKDIADVSASWGMHLLGTLGISKLGKLGGLLPRSAAFATGAGGIEGGKQALAQALGYEVDPAEAAGKTQMEALFMGAGEPIGKGLQAVARSPLGKRAMLGAGKLGKVAGRGYSKLTGKLLPPRQPPPEGPLGWSGGGGAPPPPDIPPAPVETPTATAARQEKLRELARLADNLRRAEAASGTPGPGAVTRGARRGIEMSGSTEPRPVTPAPPAPRPDADAPRPAPAVPDVQPQLEGAPGEAAAVLERGTTPPLSLDDWAARAAAAVVERRKWHGYLGPGPGPDTRTLGRENLRNPGTDVEEFREAIRRGFFDPVAEEQMPAWAALIKAGVEPQDIKRLLLEFDLPGRPLETPPAGHPPLEPTRPPAASPEPPGPDEVTPGYHWSRWMDRPPRKPRTPPGAPPPEPPPPPPVDLPPAPPMEYTGFDEFLGGAGKPDLPLTGVDEYGRSVRSDPRKWLEYWRAELPRREKRAAMRQRHLDQYKPYDGPFDELRREDAQYRSRLEHDAKEDAAEAEHARRELKRWAELAGEPPEPQPPPSAGGGMKSGPREYPQPLEPLRAFPKGPQPRRPPEAPEPRPDAPATGEPPAPPPAPPGGSQGPSAPGGASGQPGHVPADPDGRIKAWAAIRQAAGYPFKLAGEALELPLRATKRGLELSAEILTRGRGELDALAQDREKVREAIYRLAEPLIEHPEEHVRRAALGIVEDLPRSFQRTGGVERARRSLLAAVERAQDPALSAIRVEIQNLPALPMQAEKITRFAPQIGATGHVAVGAGWPGATTTTILGVGLAGKGLRRLGLMLMRDPNGNELRRLMRLAPPAIQQKLAPVLQRIGQSPNTWKAGIWGLLHDPDVRLFLQQQIQGEGVEVSR